MGLLLRCNTRAYFLIRVINKQSNHKCDQSVSWLSSVGAELITACMLLWISLEIIEIWLLTLLQCHVEGISC